MRQKRKYVRVNKKLRYDAMLQMRIESDLVGYLNTQADIHGDTVSEYVRTLIRKDREMVEVV